MYYRDCTPAPHDPTLLELHGIGSESTANQYCEAIRAFIAGEIDERKMFTIIGSRKIIR